MFENVLTIVFAVILIVGLIGSKIARGRTVLKLSDKAVDENNEEKIYDATQEQEDRELDASLEDVDFSENE